MTSKGEKSLTDKAWELSQTLVLIIFWYTVNIGLIVSNKWLISETGFHSTSVLALLHMLASATFSSMLVGMGVVPGKALTKGLALKVTVLAASFTVSVASCMASLEYLPASFVQALGSTTPGFTAGLALLVQGRLEARPTYAALLPVAGGVVLASGGEPLFSALGVGLQLVACCSRSLKTVLQAVLLTDESERFHTLTLLAYTSAISAALLTPLALATEPTALRLAASLHSAVPSFAPLLALSCGLAFLANWANFMVSKRLGALTLQVLGNFKNVVAAVTALVVFRNPFTRLGLTGYAITALGVFAYSHLVIKYPARWIPPPIGRLLGTSWAGYRPVAGADATSAAAAAATPVTGRHGKRGEGASGECTEDGPQAGTAGAGEEAPLLKDAAAT